MFFFHFSFVYFVPIYCSQLHIAIIHEIQRIIPTLIQLAPTPAWLDIQNDDAQTPLHLAVLTKQSLIVRRLLIFGASASIRDADGNTPLHLACLNGDLNSIKEMLRPITAAEFRSYTSMKPSPNQSFPCRIPISLEQRNYQGMCIITICFYFASDIDCSAGLHSFSTQYWEIWDPSGIPTKLAYLLILLAKPILGAYFRIEWLNSLEFKIWMYASSFHV